MKVKQQPDDFQVEELTAVVPGDAGEFGFYRMTKRGWATPDALALVRRRWQIDARRVSFGGLKDRHAATIQYFTIHHGPRRNFHQQNIAVEHLGQVAEPYVSQSIRGNRFQLIVRDLSPAARPHIEQRLNEVAADGVPNYFDDQRFGSVAGGGGAFIAKLWVQGKFEEGLKQALTSPYEFDRAEAKREKDLLRKHWGDWTLLNRRVARGPARFVIDYLRGRPDDFRGAVTRLKPELRTLYLAAWQSHLWNRMLARWLSENFPADKLRPIDLRLGEVPFVTQLDHEQRARFGALELPLPGARLKLPGDDPRLALAETILAEEKLTLRDMQFKGLRELFFSRGERAACAVPAELSHAFDADELHPGRELLELRFELPRGAYATLVVKAATSFKSS